MGNYESAVMQAEFSGRRSREAQPRLRALQFLRFFAYVNIFLLHTRLYDFGVLKYNGTWPVSFFFVLSGFLSGYRDREVLHFSWKEERTYMLGKLKKLYPLYFMTTILMIPFSGLVLKISNHDFAGVLGGGDTVGVFILLRNLLMLQSWFPSLYFSFNVVSWYLSTMMFLYLLKLPLELLLGRIRRRRFGRLGLLLLGALTMLAMLAYTYWLNVRGMNLEFWTYVFPVSRLPEYICGMICGMLVRELPPARNIWLFSLCEAAVVALALKLLYFTAMPQWLSRASGWMLLNCVLISVFAMEGGVLSRLFSLKIFDILGTLSFECYLLHTVVYMYFAQANLGENIGLSRLGCAFAQAFIFGITLLFAYIIHYRGSGPKAVQK